MIFTQYYLDCLSQASYLIGDETTGRAVVVDPQRDVGRYLDDATASGLTIEHVIETHVHADFVSGHLELAARTGADICYGETAQTDFPIRSLADGDRIELGDVWLEVRATPGHTPESISIVVYEHRDDQVPYGVLTGDTLFIGDVGRPDLLTSTGLTADDLARQLYRSLHTRLLTLPDTTRVFPGHGAGSACGRSMSTETQSTIGEQRRSNYALQPMTEDEFTAAVTEGQTMAPLYFGFDAHRNREVHDLLDEDAPPPALALSDVLALQEAGAVILDTRDPAEFAAGHLWASVNVGLRGRFAEYAGDVLRPHDDIVLVCDAGTELEAKIRLGRIGFDRVVGHLDSPLSVFLDQPSLVVQGSRLLAADLPDRRAAIGNVVVLDVRNPGEVAASGMVDGAIHVPLPRLLDQIPELDREQPTVVYCAGGYRSSIAASVLARHGFADVSDVLGGYEALAALQPAQR